MPIPKFEDVKKAHASQLAYQEVRKMLCGFLKNLGVQSINKCMLPVDSHMFSGGSVLEAPKILQAAMPERLPFSLTVSRARMTLSLMLTCDDILERPVVKDFMMYMAETRMSGYDGTVMLWRPTDSGLWVIHDLQLPTKCYMHCMLAAKQKGFSDITVCPLDVFTDEFGKDKF